MSKKLYRNTQALILLLTLLVLAASFYFQYVQGLQPCPLCLMQRTCTAIIGIFALSGLYLLTVKRARIVTVVQIIFGVCGLFFATRQLWLQSLPVDQAPACIPGLDILMKYFPWRDIFHAMLWGSGDCAEVSWKWLGLSMPAWAALYFIAMVAASSLIYWRLRQMSGKELAPSI